MNKYKAIASECIKKAICGFSYNNQYSGIEFEEAITPNSWRDIWDSPNLTMATPGLLVLGYMKSKHSLRGVFSSGVRLAYTQMGSSRMDEFFSETLDITSFYIINYIDDGESKSLIPSHIREKYLSSWDKIRNLSDKKRVRSILTAMVKHGALWYERLEG